LEKVSGRHVACLRPAAARGLRPAMIGGSSPSRRPAVVGPSAHSRRCGRTRARLSATTATSGQSGVGYG